MTFDVQAFRSQFPILDTTLSNDKPLVYLDSGATSQRPERVIEAELAFLRTGNAAVKRGAHQLAEKATDAFEQARANLGEFFGAAAPEEVIFTSGATAALNLVAASFANAGAVAGDFRNVQVPKQLQLLPGDEVIVTEMEHHANLIPWQEACRRSGATLKWIPLTDDFRLDLSTLDELVSENTKVIAFTHQSNVLGTINPVETLVAAAKSVGAVTVLDACQSAPHMPVDFSSLGVDFAATSAHKMYGPTGVGALWGRAELLEQMAPYQLGGSMIEQVFMDHATYAEIPARFEAGTPMISQAIGWSAAIDLIREFDLTDIAVHERELTNRALRGLAEIPGIEILGPEAGPARSGAVAFNLAGRHTHDVGQVLDALGIEVRVGHHCAWPLHRRYGKAGSTRASFGAYNTVAEVDSLISGMQQVVEFFGRF